MRKYWPYALISLILIIALGALYRLSSAGRDGYDNREIFDKWSFIDVKPFKVGIVPLQDQQGQVLSKIDFWDSWTMVYFGYTHCPDICAPTLGKMEQVNKRLASQQGYGDIRLQSYMVTVDPDRDSRARLRNFLGTVSPSVIGLTGTEAQIRAFAANFDVDYAKDSYSLREDKSLYDIGHTGDIFLLDPSGQLVGSFPQPQSIDQVIAALKYLAFQHRTVSNSL